MASTSSRRHSSASNAATSSASSPGFTERRWPPEPLAKAVPATTSAHESAGRDRSASRRSGGPNLDRGALHGRDVHSGGGGGPPPVLHEPRPAGIRPGQPPGGGQGRPVRPLQP